MGALTAKCEELKATAASSADTLQQMWMDVEAAEQRCAEWQQKCEAVEKKLQVKAHSCYPVPRRDRNRNAGMDSG